MHLLLILTKNFFKGMSSWKICKSFKFDIPEILVELVLYYLNELDLLILGLAVTNSKWDKVFKNGLYWRILNIY